MLRRLQLSEGQTALYKGQMVLLHNSFYARWIIKTFVDINVTPVIMFYVWSKHFLKSTIFRHDPCHIIFCDLLDWVECWASQSYSWSHNHAQLFYHFKQVTHRKNHTCICNCLLYIIEQIPFKTPCGVKSDSNESLGWCLHVLHLCLLPRIYPGQLSGKVGPGPWAAEEEER